MFEFHLLEREAAGGNTPLPKLNLASKFSIDRATFDSVLEDVSALSNNIRIRADKGGALTFSGKGDAGRARITFSRGELAKLESPEESDAVYTMEYIQKVLKPASSSSEVIEFSFASKMPLAASVNVGDPSRSKLKLTFFLAPRASD